MSVTATNLTSGPGTLYYGDFGETEPADTAVTTAPSSPDWTDVGGTVDGVKLSVSLKYASLTVDQLIDVPERRVTEREIMVKTQLAEPTLELLALALNGGTITSGGTGATAYRKYALDDATSATQPTYKALIVDGYGPGYCRRRVIVRKVLNVDDVEASYKKGDQVVFPVSFAAHWVSSSIKPIHIVDDDPTQ